MKKRILAIEYIRGIAMLGVIGIHTGSYALSNPHANIHLIALLEIVSRFSVPIFFFVSAFGLFINHNFDAPFNYKHFFKRRCQGVLLPYITWSLLYMLHYSYSTGDYGIWHAPLIYHFFLFGLGSYQLYFLVILLWFYLLMPLWRKLAFIILKAPLKSLGLLLIAQIAINFYSSYLLSVSFSNPNLMLAFQHRMSYWVIHYVFIFMMGAVCAVHYHTLLDWLEERKRLIIGFFAASLTAMLGVYYFLLFKCGYSPEAAINTNHQLSPTGIIYTLAATLFLLLLFERIPLPSLMHKLLAKLGNYSYLIYLCHPMFMMYLEEYLRAHSLIMTAPITIAFYLIATILSIILTIIIQRAVVSFPYLSICLTGTSTKK